MRFSVFHVWKNQPSAWEKEASWFATKTRSYAERPSGVTEALDMTAAADHSPMMTGKPVPTASRIWALLRAIAAERPRGEVMSWAF